MNRRTFLATSAGAATTVAAAPALLAQQSANPAAAPAADPSIPVQAPPPPGKRPSIREPEPFADPLAFAPNALVPKVRPFPMTQVRLLAGPCRQSSEWNRSYMSRLAADRLLHNFRVNAGLPTNARPLGGWEAPKSELRGHFTGHYLSACALLYASSGDQEVKAKGEEMVSDLARCQARLGGGYLSAFPGELFERLDQGRRVWAPFYTIHKIMAGLLDIHAYCGNRQALDVVAGMADWVDRWTSSKSEAHMQEILRVEYGGMNEVLYNLAAVTGEANWAKVGDRFNKRAFFTPLAQHRDELRNLHANTHIPQVIGAARGYEVSGDSRFRDVADFFWYTVASARTYATGGSSNAEAWLVQPGHLSLEWKASTHHQECCCAYNMMKLTRHLYEWSGDPRYIDYYERNLLNHRLGGIQPETGNSIYFLSMSPGAWKTLCTEDQTFWCCTGSALEEYAKLNDAIYYQDADGLYVNLFIASVLEWAERGIRLRQETRFPDEPRTALILDATPPEPWTMRLRIPAWTAAPSVRVNGRRVEAMAGPGSYLNLSRVWKKGDRIEMEMPMRLTVEALPDDPRLQAFLYGPVVLAGELGTEGLTEQLIRHQQGPDISKAPLAVPDLVARRGDPLAWIKPTGAAPLEFRTTGQPRDVTFSPLNRLWQRFGVYWNVTT
jgi:DUF1680 family protein